MSYLHELVMRVVRSGICMDITRPRFVDISCQEFKATLGRKIGSNFITYTNISRMQTLQNSPICSIHYYSTF
jgi:hypothetical protein